MGAGTQDYWKYYNVKVNKRLLHQVEKRANERPPTPYEVALTLRSLGLPTEGLEIVESENPDQDYFEVGINRGWKRPGVESKPLIVHHKDENLPEIWKPIAALDNLYEVSNHGRVRSKPRLETKGKILKFVLVAGQYVRARITYQGKMHFFYVHVLVAEHFIGSRPDGMYPAHIDGDKTNNRVDNLQYRLRLSTRGAKYK